MRQLSSEADLVYFAGFGPCPLETYLRTFNPVNVRSVHYRLA
jgi:hypothetical protein